MGALMVCRTRKQKGKEKISRKIEKTVVAQEEDAYLCSSIVQTCTDERQGGKRYEGVSFSFASDLSSTFRSISTAHEFERSRLDSLGYRPSFLPLVLYIHPS